MVLYNLNILSERLKIIWKEFIFDQNSALKDIKQPVVSEYVKLDAAHCKDKIPKFRNKYSQKRNSCAIPRNGIHDKRDFRCSALLSAEQVAAPSGFAAQFGDTILYIWVRLKLGAAIQGWGLYNWVRLQLGAATTGCGYNCLLLQLGAATNGCGYNWVRLQLFGATSGCGFN